MASVSAGGLLRGLVKEVLIQESGAVRGAGGVEL